MLFLFLFICNVNTTYASANPALYIISRKLILNFV